MPPKDALQTGRMCEVFKKKKKDLLFFFSLNATYVGLLA